jgi:membrane-anchored protein YejM (alkaline phosphatase superfamily)
MIFNSLEFKLALYNPPNIEAHIYRQNILKNFNLKKTNTQKKNTIVKFKKNLFYFHNNKNK